MALKDNWTDLQDATPGVPGSGADLTAEPINRIANAVIKNEKDIGDLKNTTERLQNGVNSVRTVATTAYSKATNLENSIDNVIRNDIKPAIHKASATADEAKSIAMGKATGYVFDAEEDMYEQLSIQENVEQLVMGDNLYIRDIGVPDYWWDGHTPQQLETQKVDLTQYPKKEDFKTVNGESILGEGNIEIQGGEADYELIMKVIVGYSVLTSKPADWESNYTAYYKNTGTLKEPVYTALTAFEEWVIGKYYAYTEPTGQYPINIKKEPDGNNFSFSKLYIHWTDSSAYGTNGIGVFTVGTTDSFSIGRDQIWPFGNGMNISNFASASAKPLTTHIVVCEVNNGLLEMRNYYGYGGKLSDCNILTLLKPNEVITEIRLRGTGNFHLMGNTEVYIYGVRA